MKAVVTGGTGYIGGKLCQHLGSVGWETIALVRKAPGGQDPSRRPSGARTEMTDFSIADLSRVIGGFRPDAVFHLATCYVTEHKPGDVDRMLEANVVLPARIAEVSAQARVKALVVAGSAWQKYHIDGYSPAVLHSATKQACWDLLRYWTESASFSAASLLIHDTYGEDDPRRKLFSILRGQVGAAAPLDMSPGEQKLDYVHVGDLVLGFELAARWLLEQPPGTLCEFNAGTGVSYSLREIVALFERAYGARLNINFGGRRYRPREVMYPWTGGAGIPGWSPGISLPEGIERMSEWDRRVKASSSTSVG